MRSLIPLFICSALSGACDAGRSVVALDAAPPDARPHPERHVLIWVDPASGLPQEAIREGCERWPGIGIGCDLAADPEDSDVQVYAESETCDPDGDGSYVLAYAICCGTIVFRERCFRYEDDTFDLEGLGIVMAHEVGHQFGLWWHVPRECGDGAPRHPDGEAICGQAVMNPFYDPSVAMPNDVDLRAFDIRDTSASVVDAHNHHADAGTASSTDVCIYRNLPEGGH